jgi:hypothetical protein
MWLIGLLIFFIIIYIYTVNNDESLTGYWVAEDTLFTNNADIDSMLLYIGEDTGTFRCNRECYIVIAPDVANQSFNMSYFKSHNLSKNKYEFSPTLTFDEEEVIPNGAQWFINDGTLTIMKDDKVYAKLYKRHDLEDVI